MSMYHALINALSAHMTSINLNTIFYTHVEYSLIRTKVIMYMKTHTLTCTHTHNVHTHTYTH